MGKTIGKIGGFTPLGVAGINPLQGKSALKKGKDLFLGKKDPGVADKYIDLDPSLRAVVEKARPLQEKSLGLYGAELDRLKEQDTKGIANLMLNKRMGMLQGQAQDAERKAESLVAQRGLGRSAVGLNAIINAGAGARKGIGEAVANRPLFENQAAASRMAGVGQATGGINSILGTPGGQRTFVQGRESRGRGGGLLSIAMGAAGAFGAGSMGGNPAAGFGAGQQAGRGLANL